MPTSKFTRKYKKEMLLCLRCKRKKEPKRKYTTYCEKCFWEIAKKERERQKLHPEYADELKQSQEFINKLFGQKGNSKQLKF